MRIIGAYGTPDGRWRFEVVRVRREEQYRMFHDGELLPYRGAMGTLERLLAEDGYTMADLVEMPITDNVGQAG